MVCDICQKSPATVHLTEIINDKVVEMHICQRCAQDKAVEFQEGFNIPGFLSNMAEGAPSARERLLRCNNCGLSYVEFKKSGRLGCGNCYTVFKDQLVPLLKNIHRSTRYHGKPPAHSQADAITPEMRLKELKVKLARAIESENYEEAAGLRDAIKQIEEKRRDV